MVLIAAMKSSFLKGGVQSPLECLGCIPQLHWYAYELKHSNRPKGVVMAVLQTSRSSIIAQLTDSHGHHMQRAGPLTLSNRRSNTRFAAVRRSSGKVAFTPGKKGAFENLALVCLCLASEGSRSVD